MSHKHFYLCLVCLTALNIFLLYTNVQRQNEINTLRSVQSIKPTTTSSAPSLSKDATLIHPDIALQTEGLTVSVIVPQNSCSSCLDFEVPNINKLYNQHSEEVQVYILGQNERFLAPYGFKHTARVIDPMQPVFKNQEFDFMNPVAVVSDAEGTIHNFYAAEVGNKEKSDRFYARMDRFLNAID
jgi:hypothetical protein